MEKHRHVWLVGTSGDGDRPTSVECGCGERYSTVLEASPLGVRPLDCVPLIVRRLRHDDCGWEGPACLDAWEPLAGGVLVGVGSCPYCRGRITHYADEERHVAETGVSLELVREGLWRASDDATGDLTYGATPQGRRSAS
ncbi:MAG: hypothetical protein U0838_05730 [Chloroflexota bacterium]